jgi:hypothetical protein
MDHLGIIAWLQEGGGAKGTPPHPHFLVTKFETYESTFKSTPSTKAKNKFENTVDSKTAVVILSCDHDLSSSYYHMFNQ